ncbi:MAG: polysaccharide pyruvyl transferase family protein [Bacilli bacterium]
MKKVGIVSCYFKNNYGSMLQAYATQKVLDINNIPNDTIDISKLKDFSNGKKKYYFSQIFNFNFIKTKLGMIKMKIQLKLNKKLRKNINERNQKFEEFKKNFRLSSKKEKYTELSNEIEKEYSDVIVGSDQLWLPVNVVSDYYTLNWVPNKINKISYSTSFGISNIPKKYKILYKKFLERINFLSVREKNAIELIENISGRNAELVCDPTLLLTKKQWLEIQDKNRIIKEKYIFCYFLGKNIKHRKFAERLREKTGYKIVSLNHCDEYVKYSDEFADIIPYNIGPSEFVNLIRNAEYVCTDSFHGTVFSLINNVEFYTFRRFSKKEKMSTNSRVESLLNLTHQESRLLNGDEEIESIIMKKIDYNEVNKIIDKFRNASLDWLKEALIGGEKNKISVIMPVYNAGEKISKTIDSVTQQEYENVELIIIDDGSTDCSSEICYNYSIKDKRIKYKKIKNSGVAAARNKGLQIATGKYIMFIDSDDFFENNSLLECNNLINLKKSDMYIFSYNRINEKSGKIKSKTAVATTYKKENFDKMIADCQSNNMLNQIWNKVFLKSIITDNNLEFDSIFSLGEDYRFVLNYLDKINKVEVSESKIYNYINNTSGLNMKYRKNRFEINLYNLKKLEKLFEKNKYNYSYIEKKYLILLISGLNNICKNPNKKDVDIELEKMFNNNEIYEKASKYNKLIYGIIRIKNKKYIKTLFKFVEKIEKKFKKKKLGY